MTSIFIFSILSFFLGAILGVTIYHFRLKIDPMIEVVNDLLPQIQCAQCGYTGCYPYAKAIVKNNEKINKCTPGGNEVTLKIAQVLNLEKPVSFLNLKEKNILHTTVLIDEENCVGCSKCAAFCPVDAIVGAPNFTHTVLQEFCTGCNICLSHCPTDCIQIKKINE